MRLQRAEGLAHRLLLVEWAVHLTVIIHEGFVAPARCCEGLALVGSDASLLLPAFGADRKEVRNQLRSDHEHARTDAKHVVVEADGARS